MTKTARRRRNIVGIIEGAIALYIMFSCLWTVCYLVSEIFTKLGVA